jgi:hypothetical protein
MNYIMMEKNSRRFTTNGAPSFPNRLRTLAPSVNKLLFKTIKREAVVDHKGRSTAERIEYKA